MPLFVDVFEAATSHLTLEEDGAYNRLLRLCWRSPDCCIPNDPNWIARRLRVSAEDFERVVAPLLNDFFTIENGKLHQKRQRQEFEYVTTLVEKRKQAGSRGGNAKALKTNDPDPSKARDLLEQNRSKPLAPTLTPTHTQSKDQPSVDAPSASKPKRTRLHSEWVLPKSYGEWALAQGLPRERILIEAEKMKNWSVNAGRLGLKADWFAAWKNWVQKAIDELPRQRGSPSSPPDSAIERRKRELAERIQNEHGFGRERGGNPEDAGLLPVLFQAK